MMESQPVLSLMNIALDIQTYEGGHRVSERILVACLGVRVYLSLGEE